MTRPLAVVRSYDQLREALRQRCDDLGLTREALDYRSGLHSSYSRKILGRAKVKKLGSLSMGFLLQTLGLALVVIEDPEAGPRPMETRKREPRPHWRDRPAATGGNHQ